MLYKFTADYIDRKQPLGGLLFLLPQAFNSEGRESKQDADHNSEEESERDKLLLLERLLVHANIPVSSAVMKSVIAMLMSTSVDALG